MNASTDSYDVLMVEAHRMGSDAGIAAASWFFDGNTDDATYRNVLIGLEDGDPQILDALPSSPLSGEFAGDPTVSDLLEALEMDDDDDAADDAIRAYEDGFAEASYEAIEKAARAQVFNVEPFAWPGGYPIGYLTDDGGYLCARCVSDETNPVHLSDPNDGWRIIGSQVLEGSAEDYDGPVVCAHCGAVLVEADDDDDDDDRDLREIASDWHGGQASPMYAFSSTGTVVAGLAGEARSCLAHAGSDRERAELIRLADFAEANEPDDDDAKPGLAPCGAAWFGIRLGNPDCGCGWGERCTLGKAV